MSDLILVWIFDTVSLAWLVVLPQEEWWNRLLNPFKCKA
ncbi:MAG: hypothetical protein ANABAC_2517 [Anaerolineae bacterium]|nr:MAG: hypothetical protein ANABAC_2517 [Anaerolineae bacterium]